MAESPPAARRPFNPAWSYGVPAVVGLAYAGGHLLWYRETALGHGPVVDEQENLAFAEAIVRGALPPEPFFRAAGYPLILATLRGAGVPTNGLFTAALVLGAVLHAFNAGLVAKIASTWFGRAGALAAGLLFALHPVFVHYSTQALDAVPAVTFFLLGIGAMAPELNRTPADPPHPWRWLAASLAWAAATLCRPNYLLGWGALVLLATWLALRHRHWRVAAAAGAGAVLFVGLAGWQWRVSGAAAFLPWQGTYNLWAANEPGAHGRYFVQHTAIPAALAQQNPARLESIYFFRQENGRAPTDFNDLNAYWRRRFIERITQHPLDWLGQLARKTYALANNWEQYNNKTYAFHQARSPWLRWNPLGWGLLLVLGVAGFARLTTETPRAGRRLAALAAILAVSIVLFFVSARFRLPLAALLTVLAGGVVAAPAFWRPWSPHRRLLLGAALLTTTALTFSWFDGVRNRATFVMDHALIARSAFTIGDDATAWTEASHALALQPDHRDAMRIAVSTYFNRLVVDGRGTVEERSWFDVCTKLLATSETETREVRAVAALALWRAGRPAEALAAWQSLGGTASAVAARLLIGDRSVSDEDLARAPAPLWQEPLVRLAATHRGIQPPPGVNLPDDRARAQVVIKNLFDRRAR